MVVVMGTRQHERLQETLAMLKLLALSQRELASTGRTYSTAEVRRRAKAAQNLNSGRSAIGPGSRSSRTLGGSCTESRKDESEFTVSSMVDEA
jgi:hypothetical protein